MARSVNDNRKVKRRSKNVASMMLLEKLEKKIVELRVSDVQHLKRRS